MEKGILLGPVSPHVRVSMDIMSLVKGMYLVVPTLNRAGDSHGLRLLVKLLLMVVSAFVAAWAAGDVLCFLLYFCCLACSVADVHRFLLLLFSGPKEH